VCKLQRDFSHKQLANYGLTSGQDFVLQLLADNEGLTQNELSTLLLIKPASMTNALQNLEKKGYVMRKPDDHDQRMSRVYLTPEGSQKLQDIKTHHDVVNHVRFKGFSEEEIQQYYQYLERIYDNFQNNRS
jgi:DNA-binding MarR family transcriptional regulator